MSSSGHSARIRRAGFAGFFVLVILCLPMRSSAQKSIDVFEEFGRLFDDNYAFFELRGVNWTQLKNTHRPRVSASTSDGELYSIFCQMIAELKDGHVGITWGSQSCRSAANLPWQARSDEIQRFIQTKYLKAGNRQSGAITYGMIDESTGYIDIHHMVGCKSPPSGPHRSAKEMDEALSTMKKAKKIIVDVRFNGGGYDECALGYASRFTDKKRFVYSKETYYRGTYRSHKDLYISPSGTVNSTSKVIVLTSRGTGSAAEMFVMAMMALPKATILGEPTKGIHSDIYFKKISNGFEVGLSNQKYMLPDGKVYEKVGLPPHELMIFKGDVLEQGKDEILERALAY